MDMDSILALVEGRARAYILHILGFFGDTVEMEKGVADPIDSGALIFGLISLAIGITLQDIYTSDLGFAKIDYPSRFVSEISFWVFLSLIIHLVLTAGRRGVHYSVSMVAALSVFPTAFMIGSYGAFLTHAAVYVAILIWRAPPPRGVASTIDVILQLLVIGLYLPRALRAEPTAGPRRRYATTGLIILLIGTVDLVVLWGPVLIPGAQIRDCQSPRSRSPLMTDEQTCVSKVKAKAADAAGLRQP